MGKITGFLEFQRQRESYLPPETRVKNYHEFVQPLSDEQSKIEGARCMDCGIPFCNNGCPVNNIIPDWNDLVYRGNYRAALDILHSTNYFPEFTGSLIKPKVHAVSQGAGQMRPVNSGKLLVECKVSSAAR